MRAHWRKASWCAAAFSLFAGLAPMTANAAAPVINSVVPYGNVRPAEWNPAACPSAEPAKTACLAKGPNSLFANSQPRARYQKGLLWITGNATPGVYVDIAVSDAVGNDGGPAGHIVRATYMTTTKDEDDFGIKAGDFVLPSGDVPYLNVTDLGTHWAGTNGACANGAGTPGCDPTSQDPADWGGSTLHIFAVARDPNTNTTSPVWKRPDGSLPIVTKFAGTPVLAGQTGDTIAPEFFKTKNAFGTVVNIETWPPPHWCHLSSKGRLGGDYNGNCSSVGTVPDVSWLVLGCYPPDHFLNPWPQSLRTTVCGANGDTRVNTGEVGITGSLTDDIGAAFGIASEINVTLNIFLGAHHVMGPFQPVSRNGPQASYSQKLHINDLKPNYNGPGSTPYVARTAIADAWGNTITPGHESTFIIYPW